MDEQKLMKTIQELKKLNPNNIDQNTVAKLAKNIGVKPAKLKKILHKFQTKSLNKTLPKQKKTGPNKSCPCESGKKYKKCCINKHTEPDTLQEDLDIELQDELEDLIEENMEDDGQNQCVCGSEKLWENCCGDTTKL